MLVLTSDCTIYYCVLLTLLDGMCARDKGRHGRKEAPTAETMNGASMREGPVMSCSPLYSQFLKQ